MAQRNQNVEKYTESGAASQAEKGKAGAEKEKTIMPTLDALFANAQRTGQLESIFFRRGEVEPVGKLVTLKRFRTLVKKELVRRSKAKRAAKRKRRKPSRAKKATPAPLIETPAADGSIFWKEAVKLCGITNKILGAWIHGGKDRPVKISSKKYLRYFSGKNRWAVFVQRADVEALCKLQNVGNFKVEGHTIDGKLFLYVREAARRSGYTEAHIRLLGLREHIDFIEWQRVHSTIKLYSWSDIQNHLKVGRKKL